MNKKAQKGTLQICKFLEREKDYHITLTRSVTPQLVADVLWAQKEIKRIKN